MKTIEERAKEYDESIGRCWNDEGCVDIESVYIDIAKEQQEIDIRRAVDKMRGILSMPIMKYITKSDVQPLLDVLVEAMKGE